MASVVTVLKNTPIHAVVCVSGTSGNDTITLATSLLHGTTKTFDASDAAVVITATDTITITAHGFTTGDRVVYSDGGGTVITGLSDEATYYIRKTGANTLKLATSQENAFSGTVVNLTAVGSGSTHKLYKGQFASTPIVNISSIAWSVPTGNATITRNSELLWSLNGAYHLDFNGFSDNRQNGSDVVVVTPAGGGHVIIEFVKVSGYSDTQHLNQNIG
jgi:hypothetical protein